jgi:hypothetical protein
VTAAAVAAPIMRQQIANYIQWRRPALPLAPPGVLDRNGDV